MWALHRLDHELPLAVPVTQILVHSVTGQVKTRVHRVSETQLNVKGIVQLETLASEHNTGFGNCRK